MRIHDIVWKYHSQWVVGDGEEGTSENKISGTFDL